MQQQEKQQFAEYLVGRVQRGSVWKAPQISNIFKLSFSLPILCYFIILRLVGYCIKQLFWTKYTSFTRCRLQNLTVSLIHSCATGFFSLVFFITHPSIMLEDTIHWHNPIAAQLIYFSMAYFFYDAADVMQNDRSHHALEILAHHIVIISIFSIAMLSDKFLPYTYWALLVEVNTSFLHIRSIMRLISKDYIKDSKYNVVCLFTYTTFFVFRFGSLLWMMNFMIVNYGKFHPVYIYSGLSAELFFFIFSVFLLQRILIEDIFEMRCASIGFKRFRKMLYFGKDSGI